MEVGFLSILLADIGIIKPFMLPKFPKNNIAIVLFRWCLFRLMFPSGVLKLQSKCPTWWGLTALNYHYESQCIPTPLGWYAHQLPGWFQEFSVASTFWIQIVLSFLFFAPVTSLVYFSMLCQIFLQILILLTGNYNFFNFLTIVLCLSLGNGAKPFENLLGNFIYFFFGKKALSLFYL